MQERGRTPIPYTRHDVQEHLLWMEAQGKKPAYVHIRLSALSLFAAHLDLNLDLRNLRYTRPRKRSAPGSLADSQLSQFLRQAERRESPRNLAIIYLLLQTGIRVGELCRLRRTDVAISGKNGRLYVRATKTQQERVIPLAHTARHYLQLYLRTLPSNSDWLFPSRRNPQTPITPRTVQRVLAPYGLHPHALRHTFLRSLVRSGTDISSVAALAGHQNLTTTLRYTLPHMDELEKAIDRAFQA